MQCTYEKVNPKNSIALQNFCFNWIGKCGWDTHQLAENIWFRKYDLWISRQRVCAAVIQPGTFREHYALHIIAAQGNGFLSRGLNDALEISRHYPPALIVATIKNEPA